jgi:phosphoribosylglycinamide formyltransferase 1
LVFANDWPSISAASDLVEMSDANVGSRPLGSRPRLGILISGRGSNLQSIIDATAEGALDASIAVVISNRADAHGLDRAREAGIEALHISPRGFADRDGYDRAIADALLAHGVTLVCLAGFMRLVGQPLLNAFPQRMSASRATCDC